MRSVVLRRAALVAMIGALAGEAAAQTARTQLSLDGALACSKNSSVTTSAPLGEGGCGGSGGVEIARTGAAVFSVFDHWAVRGRYTSIGDTTDQISGASTVHYKFDETRYVLDAEVGTKLPFGMFGGTSRIVTGLRYAHYTSDYDARVTSGPGPTNPTVIPHTADGAGPRIGLRSTIPLGDHWSLDSQSGAAALWTQHHWQRSNNGVLVSDIRSANTVYNLESETALTYKPAGADGAMSVSLGLRSEYWFAQIKVDDQTRYDRHSWGPFVRLRMAIP